MPMAWAQARTCSAMRSRAAGFSFLESFKPQTSGSCGNTTAQTVKGPARAPLPTSSMPTTTPSPAISCCSAYIDFTRVRSDSSFARRLWAVSTARITCLRASVRYRAIRTGNSSAKAQESSLAISEALNPSTRSRLPLTRHRYHRHTNAAELQTAQTYERSRDYSHTNKQAYEHTSTAECSTKILIES